MKDKKIKFTLVELLIVIAIIAILASMLLPSLRKARDKAHSIECNGKLKQLGSASTMYASDYGGSFPMLRNYNSEKMWPYYLSPFLGLEWSDNFDESLKTTNTIFSCPLGKDYYYVKGGENYSINYGINRYLVFDSPNPEHSLIRKIYLIKKSSGCALFMDNYGNQNFPAFGCYDWDPDRRLYPHSNRRNVVYVDGHAISKAYPFPKESPDGGGGIIDTSVDSESLEFYVGM